MEQGSNILAKLLKFSKRLELSLFIFNSHAKLPYQFNNFNRFKTEHGI